MNSNTSLEKVKGRHVLDCKWCKNIFRADALKRKFCSKECQTKWQRNSQEYKELLRQKINQFGDEKQRETTFSDKFNEKFKGEFSYHSEFKGVDDPFKSRCKSCGYIQERNAQCIRRNKTIKCNKCVKNKGIVRKMIREGQKELDKEYVSLTKRITCESKVKTKKAINEVIKEINAKEDECAECGLVFRSARKRKCCSIKCDNKRSNRLKDLNRRKKLKENGYVDYSITIDKLIVINKSRCKLCGNKVDINDYILTDEGYHISGNKYPSIDHIKPVAKGGTHTWNNVQLAHRRCNSNKSDNESYKHEGELVISV